MALRPNSRAPTLAVVINLVVTERVETNLLAFMQSSPSSGKRAVRERQNLIFVYPVLLHFQAQPLTRRNVIRNFVCIAVG